MNRKRKPLANLLNGADKSKYLIVLDHQPYHLEEPTAAGVDFQLSGHTHRGQIWPISWITDAVYEVAFGPYKKGNTRFYVSSGIGIWGGKYRIGTQSEYIVATILPGK
jgi:predicted MPP superfamily phosphohydrolase